MTKVKNWDLKIVSGFVMMARSNPHSSMPSPARSPLGEDENEDAN